MRQDQGASNRHPGEAAGPQTVARGLGWFSIALGLCEIAAPRTIGRELGLEGQEPLLRAYGFREIANGAAILAARDPAPWMWGRVAGDALDLATLACAYRDEHPKARSIGAALAAVAGVTALDVWCARALAKDSAAGGKERVRDYRSRSGFPKSPSQMRGAGRKQMQRDRRKLSPLRLRTGVQADEMSG